jgi:hypothetical protein
MNFQTMNKQRKFILIAAAAGIISMFLPWFSVPFFGSINGMHGSGFLVFIAFIGAGAVAFMGDQTKALDSTFWFVALACGALATVIVVWNLISAMSNSYGLTSYISFGFYLAVICAVALLAATFLLRAPGASIKGGFDSLKSDIEKKTDGNPNT